MKNAALLALISMLFSTYAHPQSFVTQWTKFIGDTSEEMGYRIHPTSDMGYIITGYTKSRGAGESDAWLLKTNSEGDTLWTRTYGGDSWDWGTDVLPTEDGGYLLVVRCYSFGHGHYDAWIIKTDAGGDTLWTKFWGEEPNEWLSSVQQTGDGGFIFTGHTYSFGAHSQDVWLVKSDSAGEIQWMQTYGGAEDDNASFVQQTTDGGFIIAGRTYSFSKGGSDLWLVRTDDKGDSIWSRSFGGIEFDYSAVVRQAADDGFILVGSTSSFGAGDADIWMIRTDSLGDTLWTRTYGGADIDRPYSLIRLSDGNYLIGGFTKSTKTGSQDGWLILTDVNGDPITTQTFGGEGNDMIIDTRETPDGELVLTGYTEVQEGNLDLWLMKVILDPAVYIRNPLEKLPFSLQQNHPNPFRSKTTIYYQVSKPSRIRLDLCTIDGLLIRECFDKPHEPGEYRWKWEVEDLEAGIYFYRMHSREGDVTRKMILLK